jgi:hypothetical protein
MPEPPAELGERIYARARLAGEFRLRSGAVSDEYVDKYFTMSQFQQGYATGPVGP